MATLKDYRTEQLEKLESLKKLGVNPYPVKSYKNVPIQKLHASFESESGQDHIVAGRIMSIRQHGKLSFLDVVDQSGTIQLLLRDEDVNADYPNSQLAYKDLQLLTRGDFIEATGELTKTKMGQISLSVTNLRLLSKVLRPLPEELTDKETRLRRRYVDLAVNPKVRQRFIRRSKFWQATRDFLINEGFIEINTPVLEHTTGGADATPFTTHMDALDMDYYLRISHELPLKRLLGGGFERVFDIGPRFRNENYSDEHLPEHIAFESYAAYQDYEDGMELYERMMKRVAQATWGTLQFKIGEFEVNLDQKWPVVRYADVLREKFDVDVFEPDLEQLQNILKDNKVKLEGDINVHRAMDGVWKLIRKNSAGPFWLIHEPVAISPLAKQDPDDPRVSQRFHPVIGGTEMGNGYSELNDPQEQLKRFLEQQDLRDAGDSEAQMLDIDFVEMLEYGMPPACGWSYSERYFWALEGVTAREGVIFPHLRWEVEEVTKSVYPELYSQKANKASLAARPQDFSKKIIVVVNKELEPWRVANAVAHMSAIIGSKIDQAKLISGDYFVSSDEVPLPRNSQYPIIVKRASEKELHRLFDTVKDAHLPHHVFIKEMQDTTNDQEITELMQNQNIADTVFYGVSFFAPNEQADILSKNFQLWK